MKVTVLHPSELSADDIKLWNALQRSDPRLGSPFFSPEYTIVLGEVCDSIRVGVMESGGRIVGFFPFQQSRWRVAKPVGLRLCDFSGVIAGPDTVWDPLELLHRCGLVSWRFKHVPASVGPLQHCHRSTIGSPYVDLRGGFEAYEKQRSEAGSRLIEEMNRKSRKIGREIGPLRFEWNTSDPATFEHLVAWKADQRRRTKTADVLSLPWAHEAVRRMCAITSRDFAGVVSALYAGDQLAAVHLGIRGFSALHYWFPTYNRELQKYSPGSLLLFELAKAAAAAGLDRIDLGYGDELYKLRFSSGELQVAEGAVDLTLTRKMITSAWYRGRQWSQTSSLGAPLQSAKHILRRAYYLASGFTVRESE